MFPAQKRSLGVRSVAAVSQRVRSARMQPDEVRRYLVSTAPVEGWFFPVDAFLFAAIDETQKERGIRGNLFEIGVHHGKTALMLAAMSRPDELLGVCDVFEEQEQNVDRSGEGSRELFLRNLRQHAPAALERLRIYPMRSDRLMQADPIGGCRFFHIDGGHRPDDVMNDLDLAVTLMQRDGIVAVDDVFNPSWPGVSEGFYGFMRAGLLVPVIVGGNKVYCCRPPAAPLYDRVVPAADLGAFRFEKKEWMGRSVTTAARQVWADLDPDAAARAHRIG
jgi:hypothetical protein